jgi:ferredoxin-thioredoxin reductase catalytic subunit
MPMAAIKSLAKESGKSEAELESMYEKAKQIAKKEYDVSADSDKFYKIVWGILKKMAGVSEDSIPEGYKKKKKGLNEERATGKSIVKFLNDYDEDLTDLADELDDKYDISLDTVGRIVQAYVNKIKKKRYKSDSEFVSSIDSILKGQKGKYGE